VAKYFLINYGTLPEESKKHIGLIKYFNFSILLFLLTIAVKQREQVINSEKDEIFSTFLSLSQLEKNVEKKITSVGEALLQNGNDRHKYNETQPVITSFIPTKSKSVTSFKSTIHGIQKGQNIIIHIKNPINNQVLSRLLLSIFEELQTLGEDEAYIDVERTGSGHISAVNIKGVKNINHERLVLFMEKISQDTGVSIHQNT